MRISYSDSDVRPNRIAIIRSELGACTPHIQFVVNDRSPAPISGNPIPICSCMFAACLLSTPLHSGFRLPVVKSRLITGFARLPSGSHQGDYSAAAPSRMKSPS